MGKTIQCSGRHHGIALLEVVSQWISEHGFSLMEQCSAAQAVVEESFCSLLLKGYISKERHVISLSLFCMQRKFI